jgi:hypothetical protein
MFPRHAIFDSSASRSNMNEWRPTRGRHILSSQLGDRFVQRVRDSICVNDLLGQECRVELPSHGWTVFILD